MKTRRCFTIRIKFWWSLTPYLNNKPGLVIRNFITQIILEIHYETPKNIGGSIYCSSSQPGVRVTPGVHEKSKGVRQIIICLRKTLRLLMKQLTFAH